MATSIGEVRPERAGAEHGPLLRWLIFTGLVLFACVLLWRYGLFRMMLGADRTYISAVIAGLYGLGSLHCLWRTVAIGREAESARQVAAMLSGAEIGTVLDDGGARLPAGAVSEHIRNLATKAAMQAGLGRLDQTLLLRALADRLRGSNGLGGFAADTLMKLGLLGTIVGFIIMLAPIAGLDASDKVALRTSMGMMSEGMAVAMYTTLAGLVASILVKIQYSMLEAATARVFAAAVTLTETRVAPTLERRAAALGAAALGHD